MENTEAHRTKCPVRFINPGLQQLPAAGMNQEGYG